MVASSYKYTQTLLVPCNSCNDVNHEMVELRGRKLYWHQPRSTKESTIRPTNRMLCVNCLKAKVLPSLLGSPRSGYCDTTSSEGLLGVKSSTWHTYSYKVNVMGFLYIHFELVIYLNCVDNFKKS